jgi:hypothetical protein
MSDDHSPPRRRRGLIWLIFLAPGALILWWQYYFPKSGEVWASARRKDNPTMQLLYSLAFWAVVTVILAVFVANANH